MPGEEIMSIKAMKLALEALELLARYENPSTKIQVRKPKDGGPIVTMYPHKVATEAAALLRERLAQPEQEPVAWMHNFITGNVITHIPADIGRHPERWTPLYTAPPKAAEWVGLTDDEIYDCEEEVGMPQYEISSADLYAFARAIEAKLKDKNA